MCVFLLLHIEINDPQKVIKCLGIYRQHANVVGTLSGHGSWVLSVAFSPDGKYFASSSSDKTVKVWELATKQCVHTFSEHSDQVSSYLILNMFSTKFLCICI